MKRTSVDDLLLRARTALEADPTITVYTFKDGVEHRRPAMPFAGLRIAMADFVKSMQRCAEQFQEFHRGFEAARIKNRPL